MKAAVLRKDFFHPPHSALYRQQKCIEPPPMIDEVKWHVSIGVNDNVKAVYTSDGLNDFN